VEGGEKETREERKKELHQKTKRKLNTSPGEFTNGRRRIYGGGKKKKPLVGSNVPDVGGGTGGPAGEQRKGKIVSRGENLVAKNNLQRM